MSWTVGKLLVITCCPNSWHCSKLWKQHTQAHGSSCWSQNGPSRLLCQSFFPALSSVCNTFHPTTFLHNSFSPFFSSFCSTIMSIDPLLLSIPYKMASSYHPSSFSFPLTWLIFLPGTDCHLTYIHWFIDLYLFCSLLNPKSLEQSLAHLRHWVLFVEWVHTCSLEAFSLNLTRQDLFVAQLQVWDVLFKKLIVVTAGCNLVIACHFLVTFCIILFCFFFLVSGTQAPRTFVL